MVPGMAGGLGDWRRKSVRNNYLQRTASVRATTSKCLEWQESVTEMTTGAVILTASHRERSGDGLPMSGEAELQVPLLQHYLPQTW